MRIKVKKMEDLEFTSVKVLRELMAFGNPTKRYVDHPKHAWIKDASPKEILDAAKVRLAACKEVNSWTKAKKKAVEGGNAIAGMQEFLEKMSEEDLEAALEQTDGEDQSS